MAQKLAQKLAELPAPLAASGPDSWLLLREGRVSFEWGDIRYRLLVRSIRKALLALELDDARRR